MNDVNVTGFQIALDSRCDRWPDCCRRVISWPDWPSAYSTRRSTYVTRANRSTRPNRTSVTNCSVTCRYLPIRNSPSSHRRSAWPPSAFLTNTSNVSQRYYSLPSNQFNLKFKKNLKKKKVAIIPISSSYQLFNHQ